MVLDDIRAPSTVDIDWLMQGPELEILDAVDSRYVLRAGDAICPFQVIASRPLEAAVVDSPAEQKGEVLGFRQLRLSGHVSRVRLVSVFNLWNQDQLDATLNPGGPDHATVTVEVNGVREVWEWTAGKGRFQPSELVAKNDAGALIMRMNEREPRTQELIEEIEQSIQD
jgi:hypothetical protein